MIGNYLRFLLRDLKRNPGYSSINIVGLAVGIATVLLIVLYVQHETSFDKYHDKKENLYRIISYAGFGEKEWGSYVAGDPIPEMRHSFAGVEDATKYQSFPGYLKDEQGNPLSDVKALAGESNIFNMFSFELLNGNPASVIETPNTAVITESLAKRLFSDKNPVGESIPVDILGKEEIIQITGLMKDVPINTHFDFDILVSYQTLTGKGLCLSCGQPMYVLLENGSNITNLEDNVLSYIRDINGKNYVADIRFENITDIHFSSVPAKKQGNFQYILIMGGIALLVLFIGCANYMNLATARFAQRSKEIGVRKVLGALRSELIRQFYLEAVILTVIAIPVSILILNFAIPYFNELADTSIQMLWLENASIYLSIFGLLIVIGLIAGSYPALFLSSFRPSESIKGNLKLGFSGSVFRKGLVVVQFLISIIMIVVTSVILKQLNYMQNKNLGFDSDQIIYVSLDNPILSTQYKTVKEKLLQHSSIHSSFAGHSIPMISFSSSNFTYSKEDDPNQKIDFVNPTIDSGFLETMGIGLLAGRNISDEPSGKKIQIGSREFLEREALVNKAAVKAMGWGSPESALGELIGSTRVVGVTDNFHIESLHNDVQPLLMTQNRRDYASKLVMKTKIEDISTVKEDISSIWSEFGITNDPNILFLDEQVKNLYENEKESATVIGIFAFLSIFVGCLGLFGLITFMTQQRIKEIGVRKVLGAGVSDIVFLLFRDFGKLLIVASIIAIPIAFFVSTEWLNNFAFKTSIGTTVFITSGVLVLLISIISTGLPSVNAARTNPVNTLRS